MTDVLDRLDAPVLDPVVADDVAPQDRPARTAFATLVATSGAIHLAMAPPHVGDSVVLGLGFVAAGWAQLAAAWLAFSRPSRRLWWGAAALNAALLVVWAISRTAGLPFGDHAGHPEDITIVDTTATALEAGALLVVLAALLTRVASVGRALGIGIPVLGIAAASVALASPDARGVAHGEHGDGDAHAHAMGPEVAALAERGFGTFMNGHAHAILDIELDPATQAELDRQLAITAELAAEFPTLQDAVDAGYRRAGPYVPGLGVHMIKFEGEHYLNPDGVMDDDDLRHPLSLLYLGADPDAELGGFMYYAATAIEPEGFAGRNDSWHYHESLCAVPATDGFLDFPFGPDFGATQAQCDEVGGTLMSSQWMVHVWTVPGWDDMDDYGGVFAEMQPRFGCSDGTWFSKPFEQWKDDPLNTCRSGVAAQPEL